MQPYIPVTSTYSHYLHSFNSVEFPSWTTVGLDLADNECSSRFVVLGVVVVGRVVGGGGCGLGGAAERIGVVAVVLDASGPALEARAAGIRTRVGAVAGASTLVVRLAGRAGFLTVGGKCDDWCKSVIGK